MLSYIKAASCISAITVEHIVLSLVPRRFFDIRKVWPCECPFNTCATENAE